MILGELRGVLISLVNTFNGEGAGGAGRGLIDKEIRKSFGFTIE